MNEDSATPPPDANPELSLARDYILSTGRHLFLTGRAGTGKTTFLRTLRETCPKRMVVTAPPASRPSTPAASRSTPSSSSLSAPTSPASNAKARAASACPAPRST